jgi:hypothetical protein
MASEKKVGAHTLGPIELRLKKGTYETNPAAAARNLDLLRQVTEMPKVWKDTKERATGLIHGIQAASERAEVPAAPAAAVASAGAGAAAPIISSRASTLATLKPYITKLRTRHYDAHPDDINVDIAAIQPLSKELVTAKTHDLAAITEKLMGDIAAFRPSAAAPLEERRELPVSAPAVAVEERRELPVSAVAVAVEERREVPVSAAAASVENSPLEPEVTPEQQLAEKIQALDLKLAECARECKALSDEKKALEEFARSTEIAGISLSASSKLFDLLRDRILDPAEDWATRLETLINIPHSSSGAAYLRGGDYFEALFQIAIAIGELPMLRDKFVRFHDITGYKVMRPFDNYLYEKDVKNSGGGEQGISDITFEVSNTSEFIWKPSSSYKCGISPKEDDISANPFYFISVKGFKKEKSPAKEYDIPLLNLQLSVFPEIKNKYIIVCVRNKAKLLEKLSRTKMDMLKHSINSVIGYDELIEVFTALRLKIFSKIFEKHRSTVITSALVDAELRSLYPENRVVKPMLSLYFHQELVVNSVMEQISKGGRRDAPHYLCIGVLPRGGKSFIAGGIINQHKELKLRSPPVSASAAAGSAGYNVLFLTSAVNETRSQFREDLIKKFSEFADFQFIDLVDSARQPEGVNNFYFISRQLSTLPAALVAEEEGPEVSLLDKKSAEPNILETLTRKLGRLPRFDICFFDEAHIGISADSVRKNFDSIFSSLPGGIPIVLMTATYKKPSAVLRSNADLFVWDLQDIKDMKSLSTLGLDDFIRSRPDVLVRYPHAAALLQQRVTMGETLEQLAKPYIQFANPNFISLTFAPEDIQAMIRSGAGYSYINAFEINQNVPLLGDATRSAEWSSLLRNREDSNKLLQFLTPEIEESDLVPPAVFTGPSRKFRALNQIFRIAQKNGSRPIQGRPFSILMFLPFRKAERDGSRGAIRIGELCRVWASFMRTKRYWRDNFVFLTLSAYAQHRRIETSLEEQIKTGIVHRDDHSKDLKNLIREVEKEALKQDKGLVILSGDVAKMGISLPCVDVVFMMGNNPDADDIIQKMYRALTDDPPQKKDGFIVDLDLKRIVSAMFDYDLQKDKLRTSAVQLPSIEDRAMRLFNLCDWGQDSFIEDDSSITFDDIMKAIKDRIVTSLRDKVMADNTVHNIQKKQEEVFVDMKDLFMEIQRALGGTVKQKGRRGTTEKLMARGTLIPAISAVASAGAGAGAGAATTEEEAGAVETEGTAVAKAVPAPAVLDPKEAQKRMFEIIQTFINTLVIRSAESWSGPSMNLAALMDLYWRDKAAIEAEPECECKISSECKTIHRNVYEQIFCELKAFAHEIVGTKTIFNPIKHRTIIACAEEVLRAPLIEWNIYIETLLKELRAQAGGRRRRVTRRRKTDTVSKGHGNRKTLQQCSKYNR